MAHLQVPSVMMSQQVQHIDSEPPDKRSVLIGRNTISLPGFSCLGAYGVPGSCNPGEHAVHQGGMDTCMGLPLVAPTCLVAWRAARRYARQGRRCTTGTVCGKRSQAIPTSSMSLPLCPGLHNARSAFQLGNGAFRA